MSRTRRPSRDDWASRQLQGGVHPRLVGPDERRNRSDRRQRIFWSVIYGSFNPRRRRPPRRLDDSRFHSLDWHGAHLLAVALGILILNVADAFLTVALLSSGSVIEMNPILATLVTRNVATFAAVKMAMTGISVILMVLLARYRFLRVMPVEVLLYGVLLTYLILIGYEIGMLQRVVNLQLF
jgi:Domain of unknown function (DUF5658)